MHEVRAPHATEKPCADNVRLIKTTVETVRTRLDTVYLEALAAAQQANDNKTVTGVEIKALEEEVESLYSELLPVAQMSVEQQHLEPALKAVTARSGQGVTRSATAVIYVNFAKLVIECTVLTLFR